MENLLDNLNRQAEEVSRMVDEMKNSQENSVASISLAAYERQTELADRREQRLHNIIKWMAILWFASVVGIVAGFLIYLNQFDYADSYSCSQDLSDVYGDASIQDGIHFNEYLEKNDNE